MAGNIDEWLPETGKPDILKLVTGFLFMRMLTATLDIVVDGWSLTMLKRSVSLLTFLVLWIDIIWFIIPMLHFHRNNVGYASTCNSTGLVTGIMISYIFFVLLTSEDFSNKYIRIIPDVGGLFTIKSKWINLIILKLL